MTEQGPVIPGDINPDSYKTKVWFATFTCDSCGFASLGMLDYRQKPANAKATQKQREQTSAEPRLIVSMRSRDFQQESESAFQTGVDAIQWFPLASVGKEYPDVKDPMASVASEAYSCLSINANRAAVLMARTAIEAMAKNKKITDGNLYQKIDAMAEKNIITDQLAEEAHQIRLLGNDMAHGDLDEPVSREDATEILGFLDSVLNYVYQQPAAVERRKNLRKERKQTKKQTKAKTR